LIPHGGGGASEQRLAAGMFDATPQNIVVRADGSHALFDIEWKMTGGVEPAYLVFRGLLRTIASITRFGRPGRAGALTRKDFIIGAMRAAGLDVAENDFLRYSQIEHQIQQEVCGFAFPQSHAEWHSWPLPMESLPTLSEQLSQVNELRSLVAIHEQQIADRDKQIADRDKQITDRDKQIADRDKQIAYLAACAQVLQQRLNDIEHSASWILTLPLRVTVRVSVRILCLCSLAARWLADLPANVRIWSKLPIWFHRNVLRHGGYRRMFDECAASLRREGLLGSVRPGLAGLRRLARSPLDQIETLFTSENGYVFFSGNTRSFVDVKSPLRVWSGGACFELLDAVLLRHTRPDLIRLTANGPHECGFIGIGRWGNLGTPVVDRIELGTEQFRVCAKTPRINLPTILLLPHVLECVSVAFDYDTATNIQHAMKLYPALHGMWRSYLDHVEYNCILDLKKVRNPEFSLIIVLYKNYDFLMAQLHCLAPVFATRCGEVVLIGNELENHEALRLKIMAFGDMHDVAMSLYCSNINSGFAHANNFAASVARSEQLFFMNPDIFPMGNQEDRWTSFFDPVELNVLRGATLYYGNGALMHAGMYGVTEVMSTPVTGEVVDVCRVEHYGKGIAGHPKKTDADPGDAEQLPCRPNLMVSAALWGIRKATYKRLNGLSIDYIFAYYEDADFCLRFLDSGGKIELSKESAFYHFEGIGSTVSGRSKSILWVNRYLFSKSFAKHPSMLSLEEDLDAI